MPLREFNSLRQHVATLVDPEQGPGRYTVVWNGRNDYGHPLASGVYFYRLSAGEFVQARRLVLIK